MQHQYSTTLGLFIISKQHYCLSFSRKITHTPVITSICFSKIRNHRRREIIYAFAVIAPIQKPIWRWQSVSIKEFSLKRTEKRRLRIIRRQRSAVFTKDITVCFSWRPKTEIILYKRPSSKRRRKEVFTSQVSSNESRKERSLVSRSFTRSE